MQELPFGKPFRYTDAYDLGPKPKWWHRFKKSKRPVGWITRSEDEPEFFLGPFYEEEVFIGAAAMEEAENG